MSQLENMILIVDDEHMVRESLVAYLEDEGFRVHSAVSGEDAIKHMERHAAKVMVVDLRLPGMSGSDLIVYCAQRWPGVHCLIHTGSANFSLSPELTAAGLTDADVFRKPVVHLEKMVDRVMNYLH